MRRNQCILLALACAMLPSTLSFSVVSSTKTTPATTRGFALYGKQKIENTDDFPQWDDDVAESAGSVDWDAEWKKVVENGGNAGQKATSDRPGQGYYKSEAEIAAIVSASFLGYAAVLMLFLLDDREQPTRPPLPSRKWPRRCPRGIKPKGTGKCGLVCLQRLALELHCCQPNPISRPQLTQTQNPTTFDGIKLSCRTDRNRKNTQSRTNVIPYLLAFP